MEHINKPGSDFRVFFQTLAGFALAALVMLGVGGTVYQLVAPGGWLAQYLGRNLAAGMAAFLALAMVGVCALLTREFLTPRFKNRFSELFVYAFAATGLLYAVQLGVMGGL